MAALYGEIRLVHIAAVCASGGLFFLRGLLIDAFGSPWGDGRAGPLSELRDRHRSAWRRADADNDRPPVPRARRLADDEGRPPRALHRTGVFRTEAGAPPWRAACALDRRPGGLRRDRSVARAHHPLGALSPLLT